MTAIFQILLRTDAKTLLFFLLSVTTAIALSENSSTYEYVIVGSGPGGGPLAANLARNGRSVLLLEAGGDHGDSLLQRIPALSALAAEDTTMSWDFFVKHYEDQNQAQRDSKFTWRTTNGSYYVGTKPPADAEPLGILYPRTGTLGGCGNHNAMNLALPPDNDWTYIANLTGDQSWSAQNMRRYYERLENCQYLPNGTAGHGFTGWLASHQNDISLLETQDGLLEVLKSAVNATGEGVNVSDEKLLSLLQRDMNRDDPQRYQQEGLYLLPVHINAARERSSAQTYLAATANAVNADGSKQYPLTISTNSLATRIIFENATGLDKPKAIGVEYFQGQSLYKADPRYNGTQIGITKRVTASKEIVVAGGTFNTPQILKLSGIGPKAELEEFGIPVIVDLPAVGTNLQDNYEAGVVVQAAQDFENSLENCTLLQPRDPCLSQWQDDHDGPYGQGAAPVGMIKRSSLSTDDDADLFYFGGAVNILRGYFPGFSRYRAPLTSFFWSIVKMHPQNRAGTVKLRSADPQDVPDISFNYFKEGGDHDLQALAEGVEFARGIFRMTPPPYAPFTDTEPAPGTDLRQAIMDEAFSHHASCSCPIGPENDPEACVDSRFRVQGVDKLRVVDASVFPRIPGAFPILPTFLISEKATDVMMEDG